MASVTGEERFALTRAGEALGGTKWGQGCLSDIQEVKNKSGPDIKKGEKVGWDTAQWQRTSLSIKCMALCSPAV